MAAARVLLTLLALASAVAAQALQPAAAPRENPFRASGPAGLPPLAGPITTADPASEPPVGALDSEPGEPPAEHAEPQPATVLDDLPSALTEEPSAQPQPDPPTQPRWSTPPAAKPTPPVTSTADRARRLAPPTPAASLASAGDRPQLLGFRWDDLPVEPATSAAALGLVVGLLLLTIALLKRAAPKSQRLLPGEVASLLGRVSLGGKQSAHLLKVGSKLVLVHITPEGAKPLTEVTDPVEVSRLLGLCEQGGEHSASTAFQDVFEKLANEPAAPGFLGGESPLVDRQRLAAAYANTPGGRGAR